MGKIIIKNAVQRRPGYLYYIDGEGNIMEAKMATKAKAKAKAKTEPKAKTASKSKK